MSRRTMAICELAIVARTDPIPHDAIAVQVSLDPSLTSRLLAALVGISQSTEGRLVIAENKKGLTGFAAAKDSNFDAVRRTATAAGL
jgi:ABC-type phosphate/phosphonate transport system substrate-binding protein